MMAAAFSMVFHGAFAVMAHPLQHCAGHHDGGVVQQAIAGGDHAAHHAASAGKLASDHASHHHAKIKDTNTCCSTVAAAMLPPLQTNRIADAPSGRAVMLRTVTGEGYLPPTPAKPPRPAYQS